jgi:hypothetical protein
LLSSNHWRLALGDEAVKSGPEVSFVGMAFPLASARKRLTWTGASPDGLVVGPSGKAKGEAPSADAGEEMALGVADEVVRPDIDDAPVVNVARRDQAGQDEVAQPLSRIRIKLVIISAAHCFFL